MTEWREARLRDICTGIFDCPHSTPALTESGPYVVRTQDIRSGTFRTDEAAHVSEATYQERIARAEPSPGDILFSREGTYFGVAAEVPHGIRVCLGQRMVLIRPDLSVADARFVRHWLNSPAMAAHIRGHRDGSVAERLNLPTIRDLPIKLPPLSLQRRIAGILSALDDKIELNRRLAGRLDSIARAVFREWFLSNPAAASWPVTDLAALFEVNPSRPLLRTAPAPYLDMANMPTSGPSALGVATRVPGSGARFENGDTLLARITPCLENGKTALVDFLVPGERGWGSTEYIVLRPREPLPEPFAYCLARHPDFVSYAVARMNGSSGRQRVSAAAIGEFQLRTPPPELATRFGRVVGPMFARITLAATESRTLAQVRDTLLPRLLSGDLEVAA